MVYSRSVAGDSDRNNEMTYDQFCGLIIRCLYNRGYRKVAEEFYKEVYFDRYCERCEHFSEDDGEDPCNECLENFVNTYSHKPVNFKEKNKR